MSEVMRSHERQIAGEGEQEDGVQARGLQQAKFFGRRGEQFQSGVGPQDPNGMRLERNRYRFALFLSRAADDVVQHAGMGPMHAVKVAHAQQRWTEAGGNVIEFVKNLHCSFGAGTLARKRHPKVPSRNANVPRTGSISIAKPAGEGARATASKSETPASSHRTKAERLAAARHWWPREASRGICG